jgi:uncharacterized cupin superfamily protein
MSRAGADKAPMATLVETLPLSHCSDRRQDLAPSPIPASDVIDGQPEATALLLAERPGGLATGLWSCTAERFRWHYTSDEVIHVIEGEAVITDQNGTVFSVSTGDIIHFAYGTSAVWEVSERVKKVWVIPARRGDAVSQLLRRVRLAFAARVLRRWAR